MPSRVESSDFDKRVEFLESEGLEVDIIIAELVRLQNKKHLYPVSVMKNSLDFLLEHVGFSKNFVNNNPVFLGYSVDSKLGPAKDYLINELALPLETIRSNPYMLGLSVEKNLKPKVERYFELGISPSDFKNIPSLLDFSLEDKINPIAEFILENLSLSKRVFSSFPKIFTYSLENNIKLTVEFLVSRNISVNVLEQYPQIIGLSIRENLEKKIDFYMDLGITPDIISKRPQLLIHSLSEKGKIKTLVNYFRNRSLPISMLKECPRLFSYSIEGNIEPTINFYEASGVSLQILTKRPTLLTYSLEHRLKPRTEFIRSLHSDMWVLNHIYDSDAKFCKKLKMDVKKYQEFKKEYIKNNEN